MSDFLELFFALCLFILPNFLALFLAKVTDGITYKKLGMTGRAGKLILLDLITAVAAYAVAASIAALTGCWWPGMATFSPLALVPIFTVLPMIVLHFVERKYTKPPKRIVISNVIYALLFDLTYCGFLIWWLGSSADETFVILDKVDERLQAKWSTILWVGIIALIVVFVLLKVILQVLLMKRMGRKNADNTAQTVEAPEASCETACE
jgi:hypothetical protein